MLSNDKYFEETSFKTVVLPLIALEQLEAWSPPRKIKVKIEVGIYWGTGGDEFDRNNILCDVSDSVYLYSRIMELIIVPSGPEK